MNPLEQQIHDSENLFDRLPDEILLTVFNKVHNAKSLCSSMAVCKRFHSIAPQVNQIFLSIPRKKLPLPHQQIHKNFFFKNLLTKALIKPLNFLSQILKSKSKNNESDSQSSFHLPNEVIKSFEEIRSLHVKLPCRENQKLGSKKNRNCSSSANLLKWNAEFGTELKTCVIFGAKSITEKGEFNEEKLVPETRVIDENELKLRIVWTISCLIAASARHFLMQETLKDQKLIEDLVVSDESEQGRVCMNKEQIDELRGLKVNKEDDDDELGYNRRSRVPALRMKMWYLEKMELSNSGKVIEGATLVVIRPATAVKGRSDADLVATAGFDEDEVVEEAVRKLMVAKKCYTLEMNAF